MTDYESENPDLINKLRASGEPLPGQAPTILAMGVGGGGCNAISYMAEQKVEGVDFVVLNTDRQALAPIKVDTKILLGPKCCGGYGAGSKPEKGQEAAEESAAEIEKLLTPDVQMVFVTAGMGGGTGTGAAPVVAGIAKKKGILTVGIVTIPFFFEGLVRIKCALAGAAKLQENVDAMLVINNDNLGKIYPTLAFSDGFAKADEILTTAARTISDMVTIIANINIDMRDVDTCLRNGRTALISVGYAEGENRLAKAIDNALTSPLLCDTDIKSAKKLLFGIYYSHDLNPPLAISETSQANELVASIQPGVHIKFGWGYDDSLGNKIKFTILASGFDVSVESNEKQVGVIKGSQQEESKDATDDELKAITAAYGPEQVDDLIRRQETQNYYLLKPEELDSDEAIALVEATPAYKRDKRRVAQMQDSAIGASESKPKEKSSGNITFSLDDR